jgi:hypothetical protein
MQFFIIGTVLVVLFHRVKKCQSCIVSIDT